MQGPTGRQYCQTCNDDFLTDSLNCPMCGNSLMAIRDDKGNLIYLQGFTSLMPITKWLRLFLIGFVLITAVDLILRCMEINLLNNVESVAYDDWIKADNRGRIVAWAFLASFIGTAIVFLRWIHRASSNLGYLGYMTQRFSPTWAVVWWFIPIMFLFRPYQVTNEIWKSSHPGNRYESESSTTIDTSRDNEISSGLLGWWWASWIIAEFAGRVIFRSSFSAETIDEIILSNFASIGLAILQITSAILFFIIINQITANQEIKSQSLQH